ncbi:arrestin domain-containing protein 3-like [Anabas testudineus]|uniref:arrestin domain-containing protein 3-like n=1 Tax=Anabas testudineus TaxID=64144 RepID=UPI000E46393C|nr:arrestin domain-containing protein 3-like [Anabas testudineus]
MSDNIKEFSVAYHPINKSNVFIRGDLLTGQVILELEKQCRIDSLCVTFKGKAEVLWYENNNLVLSYHNKEKFFSIKQFPIEDGKGNNVVEPGRHVYPFTFQVPAQHLPSSYCSSKGKIVYRLEAILSRSMRLDCKAKLPITFIRKENLNSYTLLLTPQHSVTDKKMKLFTSGTVTMDVNIPRSGFYQGEGIKVVAVIQNKSSRVIKPKYCLYGRYGFYAEGKTKIKTEDILKEVGEDIPPSASRTVTRIITIPPTGWISILNCNIIRTEYSLRVYLDVKFASDPKVEFPLLILPALQEPDGEHLPAT